jgi:hypothetical protein
MRSCGAFAMIVVTVSVLALAGVPVQSSKVGFIVYDIDADRPVARKSVDLVVYSDCTPGSEMLRTSATTDDHGWFQASVPTGHHLVSVSAPSGKQVRDCVNISPVDVIERCGGGRILQTLLVRIVSGDRPLPRDILVNHPCAPVIQQVCDPLNLPRLVTSKHVIFTYEDNRPFANATLEFRQYTKGKGELFGTLTTDGNGAADLTGIYAQASGLNQVTVLNGLGGSFLLQLSKTPNEGTQHIKMVKWECRGEGHLQAASE